MASKLFVVLSILLVSTWLKNSKANNDAVRQLYQQLSDIVDSNPKPQGIPFPDHIPSPKCLNDRIVIVGAGPAGIHMAYLLKKKGFRNIVVLEKRSRVGGQSRTIQHRGEPHEMGTCYVHEDYEDNVIALAKEFGVWERVELPSANIWLDKLQFPVKYSQYVIGEVMKISKAQNPEIAVFKLLGAMISYSRLHRQLFGKYDGELMQKPAPSTMNILRCTFYRFLERYNLTILKPILIASHTVQGYGHLDEVSALYGLMWNTPNFMRGLTGKLLKITHGISMIKGGFQRLWETVKTWENIDVRFNVQIEALYRTEKNVFVKCRQKVGWSKFDFLIWTPRIHSNLRLLHASKKEWSIFSKLRPAWFTTTLFDSTYGIRGSSPIDYWLSNVENKREHSVWAQRDSHGVLNGLQGVAYQNGSLPGGPDGRFIRTGVAYQYGKKYMKRSEIQKIFQQHFTKVNATDIVRIRSITWDYFPRFSPYHMAAGVLWDIFDMQGRRRTWFAGSSVCFESVKSVLEYNKLLVSKMIDANYC